MTDRDSFVNVDSWLNEIEKNCGNDVSVIVLANKCDLEQKVKQPNEYNDEDDQEREIEVTDEDIT